MKQSRLEPHQLFFIILQTQIGIGILSLPFTVHEEAGKDGWISVLIAGVAVQVALIVMVVLAARFPEKSVYDYMPLLIGKWLSKLLVIGMTVFFLAISVMILSNFLLVTTIWVFPRTPPVVFAVTCAIVAVYLVRENIQVIARFYVLASFLFPAVLLLLVFVVQYVNLDYLLPVGSEGITSILKASPKALFSLSGFELLLWLFPLTNASVRVKWQAAAGACAVSTVLYTTLTVAATTFFNTEELKLVPEPVIYMVKAVELNIVERIDLVFLSIWVVFAMTSFMGFLYISSLGAAAVTGTRNHRPFLYVLAALSVGLTLFIQTPTQLERISQYVNGGIPIVTFVLPILLLLIAVLRNKREAVK